MRDDTRWSWRSTASWRSSFSCASGGAPSEGQQWHEQLPGSLRLRAESGGRKRPPARAPDDGVHPGPRLQAHPSGYVSTRVRPATLEPEELPNLGGRQLDVRVAQSCDAPTSRDEEVTSLGWRPEDEVSGIAAGDIEAPMNHLPFMAHRSPSKRPGNAGAIDGDLPSPHAEAIPSLTLGTLGPCPAPALVRPAFVDECQEAFHPRSRPRVDGELPALSRSQKWFARSAAEKSSRD